MDQGQTHTLINNISLKLSDKICRKRKSVMTTSEVNLVNSASVENQFKDLKMFRASTNPRRFEYTLNDKATKAKVMKAAKRTPHIKQEENSTSSNLVFSAGAWQCVVFPTVEFWNSF